MPDTTYRLFYDDHTNALQSAVDANVHGLTFKQVASQLWPSMKCDSAYARLKNCLNPDKDEKLDLSEVRLLCEVTGRADPLYWLCDELAHGRPAPVAKADKQAALMREFVDMGARMERLARAIGIDHKLPEPLRVAK